MATAGSVNQSLSFDGVDDYVSNSNVFADVSGTFTMEFWVNPTATRDTTPEENSGIWGVSGQRYAIFPTHGEASNLGFNHFGAGVSVGTNGISVFEHTAYYLPSLLVYDTSLSDWNHVAIVYSNNTPSLYLNGQFIKTGLTSTGIVHPSVVSLGGGDTGYGTFQGSLDEVRIWDTARTQTQIQNNLYSQLNGNEAGLIGHYNFNESSGNIAEDGTINNNDGEIVGPVRIDSSFTPIITLAVSPSSVIEDGTTNLVYTFTRTGSTTSALTANYTLGGTATLNTDYTRTGTNNTVTFAAGSSTAKVTIDPTADTTVESNETVALTLAAGTGYTVGTTTAVTGTITNDDTSVTLAVSPSSVTEDGTTNLIYTFTRTGVTTNSLTVNYTVGGTATNGTDYTSIPTSVTFAAGSATATVIVDPTADTTVESDETVVLTLASGTGYTVGTTAAVTGTITNDDNSGNNPYILGGYIGSWNLNSNTPIDATFNKLTHLFYSFADVTSNGTVQLPQDGTGTGDIAKLQQIKAQNPNLKIMLSIGGGTENDFSSAAATVQSRANFAQSAIQLMKTNGFDGLDIDWEYPEANEDNNYIQLLAQLRQQINQASQNDGKQYLLTTALSGSPYILSASDYGSNPYDFSPQDLKATSDYVDFINVMSYDYHGPWENTTNHQSALYKSTNDNTYNAAKVNTNWAIQHYLSAGVPATDIVLGAPLYGRTWTGVNAGSNNGLFQQGTGSSELTYRELYNLLGTNGYQSFWDNSAKVPYIYSSQTKVFSTYENNQSILGKTDYVKQLGIGGAFFWEITQDLPITHSDSLINAAATNLGINNVVLPTITLAVSPSSVLENGLNNLIYTFTRTGATTNALTVNYGITGTADSSDYTGATPGTGKTITFAASASTATLIIDPTADTTVESDETVALTLASGTGYT
ncbi:glycosyl hydrolase family 18 protein, partial [Microcystis aeruginosa]|uniref:glycosyl hydrolase family 18 protein n=1 Tax=Microcystis aeruginosa TaxID=1126 RepID=UPI001E5DF878